MLLNLYSLWVVIFLISNSSIYSGESITSSDAAYREMCKKAAGQTHIFQNFRSLPDYTNAIGENEGIKFADYIINNAPKEILERIATFQKLESIGNPSTTSYPALGNFSGPTLRYIVIADHVNKLFDLPMHAKIVEIGAGFGGQCYILSRLNNFSQYYIYDLPETEALIEKVMANLNVKNVKCLPLHARLPEKQIDLLISNYAYSECDRITQLDYFEKVIKKADRGYIIYNQTARNVFGLDSLTPKEFMQLLKDHDMHPQMHGELISTAHNNFLILWDRTRK